MILTIIFLPLFNSLLCGFFGRFFGNKGVKLISFFLIIITLINSWIIFYEINFNNTFLYYILLDWFNLGLLSNSFNLKFDLITTNMLVLVITVSFFVHLFSYSYMENDPHLPRFISYLSLFTFFMIILISSSNLIQLFIGWEGVGLCSYLLINFWYTRIQANKSAIKAMIINKLGDIGLLIGIIYLWIFTGSFEFNDIFIISITNNFYTLYIPLFFVLIGVIGKSAQLGFHMWLPDAMEGPTPVSALIHAATMVTAGVFLIIRMSPIFELSSTVLILIIIIGSLTSFFSATIGMVQNDLKKVIAYSTCSQLGYMIMICGFSFYDLSLFHLINHGFFKALLFLSAGSIIHAINDEQDMRKYGALKNFLPLIFIFIIIGSIALLGLPFLSGFYSKDLIVEVALFSNFLSFSVWISISAVFITAFYSLRLIYFTFINNPQQSINNFNNIHESDYKIIISLSLLILFSIFSGYMFQFIIIKDNLPNMIYNINKLLPLFLSILGIITAIIIFNNLNKTWNVTFTTYYKNIYLFLINNWYFDILINYILSKKISPLGYKITYKFIDNQILESLGPFYFNKTIGIISNKSSKIYLNSIYSYILITCVFFVFCILLNMN
uniref:NADH-ubiquinone oxidoreductase chain 5 n=2 Tax=Hydra vulgaris TaxID=6087 RepID=I3NLH5_HYDVU|nr:NADH dehydrogenase subunit 5 [Hydra vulgaris]